jgi:hypothetical protein
MFDCSLVNSNKMCQATNTKTFEIVVVFLKESMDVLLGLADQPWIWI